MKEGHRSLSKLFEKNKNLPITQAAKIPFVSESTLRTRKKSRPTLAKLLT
jgi:hypothetical protein